MTKKEFAQWFISCFPNSKESLDKIYLYADFLISENEKYNLTRLADQDKIWDCFFAQTLLCYQPIWAEQISHILDIGSGNGCPGVILKIIWPQTKLTIIESNTKKCMFLQELVQKIFSQQGDIVIVNNRAEEFFHQSSIQYDLVTAIAVANLEIIAELTVPFAKVNGWIVLPKSRNYLSEAKDLTKLLQQLSVKLDKIHCFQYNQHSNNVLYLKKQRQTPTKYPRSYAQIKKGFDYGK